MPLVYSVDHVSRVIVVRGSVAVLPDEAVETASQLLANESVGPDYGLMFLMDAMTLDTPSEVVLKVASVLRSLRTRFKSRYAIVTARTGGVLTTNLVVFEADDGSGSEAPTSEGEARALRQYPWRSGGTCRPGDGACRLSIR